jgi:hypothetical protein
MNVKPTEWVRLTDFPSAGSYNSLTDTCISWWKQYTDGAHSGVYQVSLSKPKNIVDKDICYIGESNCLPKRISDLRSSAGQGNKVTHHMCGVFIREEKIDIESVFVRCLIDEDKKSLEDWLHTQHKVKFGYIMGYAWQEASGGHKSARINIQSSIKRLNSLEAVEKIQAALNEHKAYLKRNAKATLTEWIL